jgi:hypothetical protein
MYFSGNLVRREQKHRGMMVATPCHYQDIKAAERSSRRHGRPWTAIIPTMTADLAWR